MKPSRLPWVLTVALITADLTAPIPAIGADALDLPDFGSTADVVMSTVRSGGSAPPSCAACGRPCR